jgi:hypothetical protein
VNEVGVERARCATADVVPESDDGVTSVEVLAGLDVELREVAGKEREEGPDGLGSGGMGSIAEDGPTVRCRRSAR